MENAVGKGLAIVVMEPLRSGQPVKVSPPVVAKVRDTAKQSDHVELA
jgi:predicted aldo/keto reductase-like oxidoreductase